MKTKSPDWERIFHLIPELVMFLLVLLSLFWILFKFSTEDYLPQPFLFLPDDTLMDWFNTGFWSKRPGAYDIWQSSYPPFSFVFLDIFTLDHCYINGSLFARDCDWLSYGVIIFLYLANVFLAALAFFKNDRSTWIVRAVAFGIGFPLLFTVERGNLMLVALPFFILAYSSIQIHKYWKYLCIALTVNLKFYLVMPALAFGILRKWRAAEISAILTIFVYFLSLAYVGEGTPFQIQRNTAEFLKMNNSAVFGQVYYSTSFSPMLLIEQGFPVKRFIGSRTIEGVAYLVPIIILSTLIVTAIALLAAWLQPKAASEQRLAAILMSAFLMWQSPGGYAFIFSTFLVLLEKERRIGPFIAIISCYFLLISYDYIMAPVGALYRESWLSGYAVRNSFGISVGQFARPGLLVIIVWALSLDTITQSIKAHRSSRPTIGLMRRKESRMTPA